MTDRRTQIDRLEAEGGTVRGVVITIDGDPVTDGIVLVRADLEHGDPDGFVYSEALVGLGEFATEIPRQAASGRAFYLGAADYAPCEADWSR